MNSQVPSHVSTLIQLDSPGATAILQAIDRQIDRQIDTQIDRYKYRKIDRYPSITANMPIMQHSPQATGIFRDSKLLFDMTWCSFTINNNNNEIT